jgi:hypothetical protein
MKRVNVEKAQGNTMADSWTTDRFPEFEIAIRQLTEQHRQLQDEPLHLAVSYAPEREQQDIFLFEVIADNGRRLCEDRELFETVFTSHSEFPLRSDQSLHLVLATPAEWEMALREQWPSAEEIRKAIAEGNYQVLHSDEIGRRLLGLVHKENFQPEKTAHG